jgi:hypothetical protein
MALRARFLLTILLLTGACWGQADAAPPYDRVVVEPTRTSIYVGSVSLRMPPFERHGDLYRTTYRARVVPYFFQNEHGWIEIEFGEDALRRLAAGERVEFTGRAANHQDEPREVTGHADPADATSGRIKVRVRVTPKIELIFNTQYRFE